MPHKIFFYLCIFLIPSCKLSRNSRTLDVPVRLQGQMTSCVENLRDKAISGQIFSKFTHFDQKAFNELNFEYFATSNKVGITSFSGESLFSGKDIKYSWELSLSEDEVPVDQEGSKSSILYLELTSVIPTEQGYRAERFLFRADYSGSQPACNLVLELAAIDEIYEHTEDGPRRTISSRNQLNGKNTEEVTNVNVVGFRNGLLGFSEFYKTFRGKQYVPIVVLFSEGEFSVSVLDEKLIFLDPSTGNELMALNLHKDKDQKFTGYTSKINDTTIRELSLLELKSTTFATEGITSLSSYDHVVEELPPSDFLRSDFYLQLKTDALWKFDNTNTYFSVEKKDSFYALSPKNAETKFDFPTVDDIEKHKVYTKPTYFLDFNESSLANYIKELKVLIDEKMTYAETIQLILTWVNQTIAYDNDAVALHTIDTVQASDTLYFGKGVCQHYAALFTSIARALGYPTRIIAGFTAIPHQFFKSMISIS